MKVSIITVCFNSAATIRDTINSVLAQSYDDTEYIVVDGASIDGTMDVVREYEQKIAHIVSEPDSGISDRKRVAVNDPHQPFNQDLP